MKYDVTIGIPVYRSEPYIRRALESALAQSYPSIEFLLVDDGGGDRSVQIVEEIQASHPRGNDVRILSHRQNLGVAASRNQIIDEALGSYLYFMDSDDVIAEHTIEVLMQQIQMHDAEIAFGSYEKIEITGERVAYQYPSLLLLGEDKLAAFAYRKYAGIQASACNYLVRTSLLRDHHHRFVDASYWEDMVFTFDLVTSVSRAVLLSDITYTYICRENSLSHYQARRQIPKEEVFRNVRMIDHLKATSSALCHKAYFPDRCYCMMMTDFYIACHILKRRKEMRPSVTSAEIRAIMAHPATMRQICAFPRRRGANLGLWLLGKLPPTACVAAIWTLGKVRKLI